MNDQHSLEQREVSPPDEGWRHLHPLTPLLHGWRFLAVIIFAMAGQIEGFIKRQLGVDSDDQPHHSSRFTHVIHGHVLMGLGIAILLIAALTLLGWASWKVHEFRVDDDAVYVRRGLINKQLRKARLSQIQAVDVQQNLVPRLFGLAMVTLDVAGGRNAKMRIDYLPRAAAEELRDNVLRHIRTNLHGSDTTTHSSSDQDESNTSFGREPGDTSTATSDGDAIISGGTQDTWLAGAAGLALGSAGAPAMRQERPSRTGFESQRTLGGRITARLQRHVDDVTGELGATLNEALAPYEVRTHPDAQGRIVRVPPHRIAIALLLIPQTLIWVAIFVGLLGFSFIAWLYGEGQGALSVFFAVFFPSVGGIHVYVQRVLREANFSVGLSPDGLTVTHGLLSTTRRSIPLHRVQAVELEQPVLWRIPGWWRVKFNIANHAHSDTAESSGVLLPVGSYNDAIALCALALPAPTDGETHEIGQLLRSAMYGSGGSADNASTLSHEPRSTRNQTSESDSVPTVSSEFQTDLWHSQPRSSRLLDPLTWKRAAWARTDQLLVIRGRRLQRRVTCVPHARVQSMSLRQGPIERRLRLASLGIHSTAGPIKPRIPHQNAETARQFLDEYAVITKAAREQLPRVGTGAS